jgi:hypothetical protein
MTAAFATPLWMPSIDVSSASWTTVSDVTEAIYPTYIWPAVGAGTHGKIDTPLLMIADPGYTPVCVLLFVCTQKVLFR